MGESSGMSMVVVLGQLMSIIESIIDIQIYPGLRQKSRAGIIFPGARIPERPPAAWTGSLRGRVRRVAGSASRRFPLTGIRFAADIHATLSIQ
jgi:hypothetical protein